ncbi:hypothetical protein FV141_04395 [Dermacoccus abyssi]|uniref:Uncharacterized protein n=1 Tax=Dermacoccus abyssi TaxID=322596 RepID=A0ABX5Z7W8_9MICO|nr:hypothetical protein FV141_04395 [Dermacoccus abyssi]
MPSWARTQGFPFRRRPGLRRAPSPWRSRGCRPRPPRRARRRRPAGRRRERAGPRGKAPATHARPSIA